MGATRSVAKNTMLLTIGLLSGRALGVLVFKKMTPILGPSGMGVWGAAVDLTAILQIITNFGLGTLLTREITRARGMTLPLLWSTLKIRWALGVVCYVFAAGFVYASGYSEFARTVAMLAAIAIFVESTSMACDSVLQAHEKVQYQSLGQIVSAVVYFVLGWWWLEAGYGLMGIIWANLASRLVRLLVMAPLMFWKTGPWRWHDPDANLEPPTIRWLMKLGLPIFLSSTFGILYNKVDTLMLKNMLGESVTGIYVLGHRALDIMMILPGLFGTALFPAMARYGQQDAQDTVRLGERALRFMMVVMMPLTLFLTFTARPIVQWFDPSPAFADSIPVLQIVIWGLPLYAATIVVNRLLITADRQNVFVTIALVAMIANVSLNAFLIPQYSYFGASWATIVAVVVSFWLHFHYLAGTQYRVVLTRALGGPPLATIVAWFATVGLVRLAWPAWGIHWTGLPLDAGWVPFLVSAGMTAVLYLATVFALRIVKVNDLELLKDLVRR